MQIDLSRFREAFLEEAREHLATMEAGLLRLEEAGADAPADAELLNTIFRAAHSIKGSAGMFGFTAVAHFTHGLEGLLQRLRDGEMRPTPSLVDLLLTASDLLTQLVDGAKTGAEPPAECEPVLAALDAARGANASGETPAAGAGTASPAAPSDASARTVETWRVRLVPSGDLLRQGADPLLLLRDLADLGELADVRCEREALPPLALLDPERCYLRWTVLLRAVTSEQAIREVFAFVDGDVTLTVERVAAETPAPDAPARVTHDRRGGGDRRLDRRGAAVFDGSSIRVSVEKVDELINLVGELIISQSMVSALAATVDPSQHPALSEAVTTMERNVRDLQERVMSVRMVPVGALFSRFPRLVRDVSAACGKSVALELDGADTELDKEVIERLGDPLTHLVRNAVDHGVEPAEARRAAGKSEQGTVKLSAFYEGGSVVIDVTDDGAGLDAERLRRKAVAQGLVREDEVLTPEQCHQLVFRPGLSTAAAVTDISGRGVGMDVVRRNVEALNGTISIQSTPGRGTTFRIRLPLTLAIIEGMQLRVAEQVYVLPLLSIVESFRPAPSEVRTVLGDGEVVLVRGDALPLHRLGALLAVEGAETDPTRGLVVILEHDGKRVGLLVDELLGQSQVVIKNLEANFKRVEGLMGATIMGDGKVALILDVDGVLRIASRGAAQVAVDQLLADMALASV